ncbi:MAG: DUF4384 domain-containing protein [Candidatus Zixiibacteriota bacterium]
MKKLLKFTLMVLILGLAFRPVLAQDEYYPDDEFSSSHVDIDVWVDRGDGSVYNPGDEIRIFFEASRDCYVVVYNIDTRGYVNILYPYDYTDSPWVEGNQVYRIPGEYDDYDLRVDGPEGLEYVQAIASLEPIVLPDWPRYVGGMKEDHLDITVLRLEDEDPYDFMETINYHLIRGSDHAVDLCIFNVEYPYPRWYYHPQVYWVDRPWYYPMGEVYIGCPFGGEVYIDGMFYGICPITIPSILCGRHWITVYWYGCRVWWDWVHIYPDRTIRIRADFPRRYRFAHDGVIKKKYKVRKEKGLFTGRGKIAVKEREYKVSQKKKIKTYKADEYVKKKETRFEKKSVKKYKDVSTRSNIKKEKKTKLNTSEKKKKSTSTSKVTKETKRKETSAKLKKKKVEKTKSPSLKKVKSIKKSSSAKSSKTRNTSKRKKR